MSDMRKNTGMNPCLSQSNDISAPYILLCNYADATPKLVSSFQLAFLIYEHVSVMVRLRSEDLHQEIWRAGQLTINLQYFSEELLSLLKLVQTHLQFAHTSSGMLLKKLNTVEIVD